MSLVARLLRRADTSRRRPWSLPRYDLFIAGRRVLRISPRRGRIIYGPVTVLRAGPGGRTLLRSEVSSRRASLAAVCGVLVCTPRGSVMLQFRRWAP